MQKLQERRYGMSANDDKQNIHFIEGRVYVSFETYINTRNKLSDYESKMVDLSIRYSKLLIETTLRKAHRVTMPLKIKSKRIV